MSPSIISVAECHLVSYLHALQGCLHLSQQEKINWGFAHILKFRDRNRTLFDFASRLSFDDFHCFDDVALTPQRNSV